MNAMTLIRAGKIVALLAFFLPWMAISCQGEQVVTATGFELATSTANVREQLGESRDMPASAFLFTVALALVVGGFGVWASFGADAARARARATLAGAVAATFVFISPVAGGVMLDAHLRGEGADSRTLRAINTETLPGWWISLIGFSLAAGVGFLNGRGQLAELRMPPGLQMPSLGRGEDVAFWDRIRDSGEADLYTEYLIRFPNGRFADLARIKLERLGVAAPVIAPDIRETRPAAYAQDLGARIPRPDFAASLGDLSSLNWGIPILLALLLGLLHGQLSLANLHANSRFEAVTGLTPDTGLHSQFWAWQQQLDWWRFALASASLAASLFIQRAGPRLVIGAVITASLGLVAAQVAPSVSILTACLALPYAGMIFVRPVMSGLVALHWPAERNATGIGILLGGSVAVSVFIQKWAFANLNPGDDGSAVAITPLASAIIVSVLSGFAAAGLLALLGRNAPRTAQTEATSGVWRGVVTSAPGLHVLIGVFLALNLYWWLQTVLFDDLWRSAKDSGLSDSEMASLATRDLWILAPIAGYLLSGFATDALRARHTRAAYWVAATAAAISGGALFLSATADNGWIPGFIAIAGLAASVPPATAILMGAVRADRQVAAVSILTLMVAIAWGPANEIAYRALADLARTGLASGDESARAANLQLRLMFSLLIAWPVAHFLIAGKSAPTAGVRPATAWITLLVLGAALAGGAGWTAWTQRESLGFPVASIALPDSGEPASETVVDVEAPLPPEPAAPEQVTEPLAPSAPAEFDVLGENRSLEAGQAWFGLEVRDDCGVYFNGELFQRLEGYANDQMETCGYLPTPYRSPTGRWIAVHTRNNDYGYNQLAMIDTFAASGARSPQEVGRGKNLFPTGTWSGDEQSFLMKHYTYLGEALGDLYQLSLDVPCVYAIEPAELRCPPERSWAGDIQMAALRADRRADCLAERNCYLVMEIRDSVENAGEYSVTGVVQLQETTDYSYSVAVSETFRDGFDIVWFDLTARIDLDGNIKDITLTRTSP